MLWLLFGYCEVWESWLHYWNFESISKSRDRGVEVHTMDEFIVVILQSYTFCCHAFFPACPVSLLLNELRGRICVWDFQYCTEFLRWAGSTFQMNISTTLATSHSHKLSFCLWNRSFYPKARAYFWHRCLHILYRLINLYLLSSTDSARDFCVRYEKCLYWDAFDDIISSDSVHNREQEPRISALRAFQLLVSLLPLRHLKLCSSSRLSMKL